MTIKEYKEDCLKNADRLWDIVHNKVYDPRTEDVYDTCSEAAKDMASEICEMIIDLTEKIPEWTPSWEKLPEKGKTVLAYFNDGYEDRVTLAVHYDNGWYDYTHYCMTGDIKYWMELPEKPEEEAE